ncbi:MAG: adenylate/guanylate cyclase domain-containing protein [Rhodospirillales bacterium]|nr:adenylate/guanylate cyclase domain-containing protein [Rhodospirillales bacterium]
MELTSRKRWLGKTLLVALAVTAVFIAFQHWDPAPLQVLRMKQLDVFQRIKPRPITPTPVTIIDIDNRSLDAVGQWPWPRTHLALLVRHLIDHGAAAVGFDVLFAEADQLSPAEYAKILQGADANTLRVLKSLPGNDAVFAQAIGAGRVVLGQALTSELRPGTATKDARKATLGHMKSDSLPFFSIDKGSADPRELAKTVWRHVRGFNGIVRSRPELERAAKGIGATTVESEADGVVRRIPLILRAGDYLYPSLGVEMLRVATGTSSIMTKSNALGMTSMVVAKVDIPTDENGRSWIRYTPQNPNRYVSAVDLLTGKVPAGRLRGHLVLVGASASALGDVRETPLNPVMPGVEIHAQWLETVLTRSFLKRPNYILGIEYLVTALFCLVLALTIPLAGALTGLLIGVAGVAGLGGISWYLFVDKGILLGVTYPVLAGFLLYTSLLVVNYLREETQRREVRHAFSHYLSPDLVSQITDDPAKLQLGGENRELTFLFTDLASFTSLVEKSGPHLIVELLNDYLEPTCDIVMKHGGTIDKIVGDAIHAMFGAPNEQPDHADRAVACALELDEFCRKFEKEKHEQGIPLGITRIGVNTGTVVVGNFGGKSRFDYTAHGDAINTAARLESVNKHLGTRVCISKTTLDAGSGFIGRPVGELVLKGKEEGLGTFEPLSAEDAESPHVKAYLAAYELMAKGDPGARDAFARAAEQFPDDPLIAFHLARFTAGQTGTRIVMSEK